MKSCDSSRVVYSHKLLTWLIMAGAFSGHLIDAYNPSPFNSSIRSHGAMSFNPGMHGPPFAQQLFSLFGSQSPFCNDSISEETAKKIATLQVKLDRKLGPEFISQRPGPAGGPKLTYVEGWKVINLANEVFGFNGWSSSIVNLATDFVDFSEETKRYTIGVTAVVRVTLRDGVHHEDIGYGISENSKSKGAALDKVYLLDCHFLSEFKVN
jgi:DNA repair and recombination protein RAD52